jgi:hypothetical protein
MDSCCASAVCPEGFFYTFDHFQQTNWNKGTCNLQSKVFDPNVDFFLMNHRMNKRKTNLPWEGNMEEFNRYNFLLERFQLCTARAKHNRGHFWSVREVLDFVTEVNQNRASGGGTTAAETMPWIVRGK